MESLDLKPIPGEFTICNHIVTDEKTFVRMPIKCAICLIHAQKVYKDTTNLRYVRCSKDKQAFCLRAVNPAAISSIKNGDFKVVA